MTAADLETATLALTAALAAMVNGGKLATAEKNQRKAAVVEMLKRLAYFERKRVFAFRSAPTSLNFFQRAPCWHFSKVVTNPS